MKRVGGHSCAQHTRKYLYKILTDEVALHYSWDGAKAKQPFKNLRIGKALLGKCKPSIIHYLPSTQYIFFILEAMKSQYLETTESDIVAVIRYWLGKAKERITNHTKANTQ